MRPYSYAWEQFSHAIYSLTGKGSQSERLVNSYVGSIIHVRDEQVPKEILEEFRKFRKDITRVEPKGEEGSVQATVNDMDEIEIQQMIDKIVSFYDTIARSHPY